jgi:hypothetical protein
MEEKWVPWEVHMGLNHKYVFDRCIQNNDGLTIYLFDSTNENDKVEVFFETYETYQYINESYKIRLLLDLSQKYGTEFISRYTFFEIKNSNYIRWLFRESNQLAKNIENCLHFVIVSCDEICDIISFDKPQFKVKHNTIN